MELLQKIGASPTPRPRELAASVPVALEAICVKAMSTRRADRYQTAAALADDVKRWLADEPVSAYRDRLLTRGGRWMRQHRMLVAGASTAALVAMLSLLTGVTVLSSKNRQLQTAHDLVSTSNQELLAANDRERAAKQLAEDRFELALDAIEKYYTGASEDVLLKQEGLNHILDGILFLSQRGGQGVESYRTTGELVKNGEQQHAVHVIEAARVDLQLFKRFRSHLFGHHAVSEHFGKIPYPAKQRVADPWQDIEERFPLGSRIKGKIVNILPYGVFVELDKGIEGLIHISEISWQKKTINPQEMFSIGENIEVMLLNIDRDSRRISLSIKQLEANPWLEAENKCPVGSKVSGKITGFTDYGAFVELGGNLEGMIHISDLDWVKRINNPQESGFFGYCFRMLVG